MDAIQDVAVAWESITSSVIQNCFINCGFGIEDAVGNEDVQDNSDWVELHGPVDCPSTFDEFIALVLSKNETRPIMSPVCLCPSLIIFELIGRSS
jgi:hypothetical protein